MISGVLMEIESSVNCCFVCKELSSKGHMDAVLPPSVNLLVLYEM